LIIFRLEGQKRRDPGLSALITNPIHDDFATGRLDRRAGLVETIFVLPVVSTRRLQLGSGVGPVLARQFLGQNVKDQTDAAAGV